MQKLFKISNIIKFLIISFTVYSLTILSGCEQKTENDEPKMEMAPHVMAANQVEAGRYLQSLQDVMTATLRVTCSLKGIFLKRIGLQDQH